MACKVVGNRFLGIFPVKLSQAVCCFAVSAVCLFHLCQRIGKGLKFGAVNFRHFTAGLVNIAPGCENFVPLAGWSL